VTCPAVLPNPVQEEVFQIQLVDFVFSFRLSTQSQQRRLTFPRTCRSFLCLTGSHIFGSQKQGGGHAKLENDLLCTEHGPSKKAVRCAVLSCTIRRSHRIVISQKVGTQVIIYDQDQEPGDASLNSFFQFSLPHTIPLPRPLYTCTGSLHVFDPFRKTRLAT